MSINGRGLVVLVAGWLAIAVAGAHGACLVDSDCTDNNVCTGVEKCIGGQCTPGTPLNCSDQNPCTLDACDPLVGCQHALVTNGTSCSDGVFCNGAETCQNGACVAGQPLPNGASCDDGNACTTGDTCQGGACKGSGTRSDGSQCSDGNPCNGLELCFGGVCTPGQASANGTPCGDGNPCNGAETCQAGVCTAGTPLPDGALCSDAFVCNGTETCKSHLCVAGTPAPNGTSCSDGNVCNGAESCQNGVCTGSSPLNCDDNNPCTTDSCNPTTGCQHANKADGSSCSDHDPCNGAETCLAGQCTPGAPEPDGTPCDDDNVCNGLEECQSGACTAGPPLPNGTPCDDGNACNGTEACQGALCVSTNAPNCDDGNPCTADSCSPASGCHHVQLPDGTPCEDNDVCNGFSTCGGGQCAPGTPLQCADSNPTTIDGCDPTTGCTRDRPMAGALLNVRQNGLDRWGIRLKSTDDFSFGGDLIANGSAVDPVLHGADLRIVSPAAGFDGRYHLPAELWSYIGKAGENAGYRYRDRSPNAPIRVVQVKSGRPWKVTGRSNLLGPHLDVDPTPVSVHLTFSNQRYCMQFGGTVQFAVGVRFRAKDAPAPASCNP